MLFLAAVQNLVIAWKIALTDSGLQPPISSLQDNM